MAQLLGYRNMALKYQYHSTWFRIIRPVTLTASIMPVTTGTLLASRTIDISMLRFAILLVASVLIQSAVNMLNDYFDFMKGQEEGKWEVISAPSTFFTPQYAQVPYVSILLVSAVSLITLWLAAESSIWIIPLGIAGLVLGYCYSAGRRSLSSLGLGEVAAAICLGPLPLVIAVLVQGASASLATLLFSIPFSLLMASMVLTNNIRDIQKDSSTRCTVAIRLGREKAIYLLTAILFLTYVFSILIYSSVWVLVSLPAAVLLIWHFHQPGSHNQMGMAALHHAAHSIAVILAVIL